MDLRAIFPVNAYSDYMSALAYAESIFTPAYSFSRFMSPKDLIFPVMLTPAPIVVPSIPVTT